MSGEGEEKERKRTLPPTPKTKSRLKAKLTSPEIHAIDSDWKPTAISKLPRAIQGIVAGWPKGAYEAEAEGFKAYWQSEANPRHQKLDWGKAWEAWVVKIAARVTKNAEVGVVYNPAVRLDAKPNRKQIDNQNENQGAKLIRSRLSKLVDHQDYQAWFVGSRFDVVDERVILVAPSAHASDYQRANYNLEIQRAANMILGPDAEIIFSVGNMAA